MSAAAHGCLEAWLPFPWRCVVAELAGFLTVREVADIFLISLSPAPRNVA